MFKAKIADFIIEFDNRHELIKNFCKDYIVEDGTPDFVISCTDEEISAEMANYEEEIYSNPVYAESVCLYRNLCLQLPLYDSFVMHGAAVEVDGNTYIFTAQSGTGKTTHIRLWREIFGERLHIVNGDKPILRFIDGELYAYGTPWCGKEGYNMNIRSKMKAICFLERAKENNIYPLEKSNSAERIMRQIIIPKDAQGAILTLELMDRMLNKIDTWLLECNISIEAAKLSYENMSGDKL